MTILELIKNTNTDSILKAVKYFYPEDKNDYSSLIENLKKRKPNKGVKGIIDIGLIRDDDEEFYTISYISNNEICSTSFLEWDIYLNCSIDNKSLNSFRSADLLAHIIWDITFFGDEEDMQKESDLLIEAVNQITKASS